MNKIFNSNESEKYTQKIIKKLNDILQKKLVKEISRNSRLFFGNFVLDLKFRKSPKHFENVNNCDNTRNMEKKNLKSC